MQDYHDRYRKSDKLQDGSEIEWPVPFWYVDEGARTTTPACVRCSGSPKSSASSRA